MNMDMPAGDGHAGMAMQPRVTAPQITAVTLLTLLALAGGVLIAALYGDFSMRAANMDVGAGMGGMQHGGMDMRGA